jgi:hypothetical protein
MEYFKEITYFFISYANVFKNTSSGKAKHVVFYSPLRGKRPHSVPYKITGEIVICVNVVTCRM